MLKLDDVINSKWLDAEALKDSYASVEPFPHIVMDSFLHEDLLTKVCDEFPDLSKLNDTVVKFDNAREIKSVSKGMQLLSPSALGPLVV
jgi:hypothetical protein